MAQRCINTCRGRKYSRPYQDHRYDGQGQCYVIVKDPAVLEICDLVFLHSGLYAGRTDMLSAQFHIAERAYETPAHGARRHRLAAGVKVTGRFVFRYGSGSAESVRAFKKSRKDFDRQVRVARWTFCDIRPVFDGGAAYWTVYRHALDTLTPVF